MEKYHRRYEHLYHYWHFVKDALLRPIEVVALLSDGFWPIMWFASTLEVQFVEDGSVCKEYNKDDHFVGQRWDCHAPYFWVSNNLYDCYFVAIQPANGDSQLLWIARAKSSPNSNLEKPNWVLIQYFQPISRSQQVQEFYMDWNSKARLSWKIVEL